MPNRRIFYAVQSVGFAPFNTNSYTPARGVQNVGINTTFNLQQIFELGQLSIYENIELVPEVEVTMEKAIDGYPMLCHLATNPSPQSSLVARSTARTMVALNVFGDTQMSASGTSIAEVNLSGMYWSSSTFTMPIDGNCTESITLVGNNKQWRDIAGGTSMLFTGFFTNTDVPFALTSGSGGVQRREDIIFAPIGVIPQETGNALDANGQLIAFRTILPPDIPGISSSGTNDGGGSTDYGAHIQGITVTANLNRESIYELGRKGPFFRYVNFPVEIGTDIDVLLTKWDNVSALENGIYTTGVNQGNNVVNRTIRVRLREGMFIYTGTSNKLRSVSYSGGDTGGGNVMAKYSYVTFNDLWVTHPQDPSNLPWPY